MKTCKQLSYSEKLKRRNVWLWLLLGLMLVYMVLVGELGLGDSRMMSPLAESVSRIIFFGGMIWVGCKIARNKRILRDTQLLRACMEQELDERNRFLYEKSGGVGEGFLRNNLSNNEQMSIRHSDAHLLMWSPNAMHRNGAYNCALLRGRKSALVCSTNWNLLNSSGCKECSYIIFV